MALTRRVAQTLTKDLAEDIADYGQDSLDPDGSEKEKMRRDKKVENG
jgi:hypothetical protein